MAASNRTDGTDTPEIRPPESAAEKTDRKLAAAIAAMDGDVSAALEAADQTLAQTAERSFSKEEAEAEGIPFPEEGQTLWRAWGSPRQLAQDHRFHDGKPNEMFKKGSFAMSQSWTSDQPQDDYGDVAGLPGRNTGRFVVEAQLIDVTDVTVRRALPAGGNAGGAVEVLVPQPQTQLRIVGVYGQNPPYQTKPAS